MTLHCSFSQADLHCGEVITCARLDQLYSKVTNLTEGMKLRPTERNRGRMAQLAHQRSWSAQEPDWPVRQYSGGNIQPPRAGH